MTKISSRALMVSESLLQMADLIMYMIVIVDLLTFDGRWILQISFSLNMDIMGGLIR